MSPAEITAERIREIAHGHVCVTRETWIYNTDEKAEVWRIWSSDAGASVHGATLEEVEARMIDVLKSAP